MKTPGISLASCHLKMLLVDTGMLLYQVGTLGL